MAEYVFSKQAVKDLSDIWNYTFDTWSEKQADRYYRMLIDNCRRISENPDIGKKYEGVVERLSGHKVGRHIIFYRELTKNKVEILRILHERMDLESRMNDWMIDESQKKL